MQDPAKLKWMDAERLVDALAEAIDTTDDLLQAELLALRLTVARLGGVHSAMRVGRSLVEELRAKPARRKPILP